MYVVDFEVGRENRRGSMRKMGKKKKDDRQ